MYLERVHITFKYKYIIHLHKYLYRKLSIMRWTYFELALVTNGCKEALHAA
jgi:hypothetical protein